MNNLIVSSSPHIRGNTTTRRLMADVLISLVPCLIAGTIFFGFRALLVVVITTATAVITEYVCCIIMKRPQTAFDLSAAVTGMILGLILPPGCDFFAAMFGSVVAIVVIKQMFGGLGQNFANPASAARIIIMLSFSSMLVYSGTNFMADVTTAATTSATSGATDALTSATPLAAGSGVYSYLDLFLGNRGGCIGETSILAILIGFVYLLVRKVINPIIPLTFAGSAALLALISGEDVLYTVMSGGLMFGAVYMATDYSTSPMTNWGKVVFGIGCGIITMGIRIYGRTPGAVSMPEGVSYAILIMNIITPQIDSLFSPVPFGSKRRAVK
jgi:electron transport complex protein RnfD